MDSGASPVSLIILRSQQSGTTLYVADSTNRTIRAGELPLGVSSVVSRKIHGKAGAFDIDLPLTGEPGVECRDGTGSYTLVMTANHDLVDGSVTITSGTAKIVGSSFAANTMAVELEGVADQQQLTIAVGNVTDAIGQPLPDFTVNVNMLIGDVSGNKTVNSSDIAQTKIQSGAAASGANFRTDVNISGTVGSSDLGQVKANAGHTLP